MKIGFIGAGTMGLPMIGNLRKANFDVAVYVRRSEIEEAVTKIGCTATNTYNELASTCDAVLLCVPNDAIVEEIVAGSDGLLASAKQGLVIIDHSTVSPYTSRKLYQLAKTKQVSYLDAPISGGPMGAEAGTLTIMVGGDRGSFDAMMPVFNPMGENIRWMGESGAGNIAKLVNQLVIGVTQAALSEGFVLGSKMGVDPQALYEVLATSTGNSAMLHRTVPNCILKRDFSPKFTIDLLFKDLSLANDMGRQEGVRLLASNLAEQIFQEARNSGHGAKDIAALLLPLEKLAKVEVKNN
ncbi:NAD(P)-dependent oxidoreductase [Effusibacillus dendaii]|uniref:2-hydroxy-3-oxopropionate reductase n=1 Tax=Effusibacillus dendaii TaxID=2743772 RepID=A0A7I8DDK8_9BACL|nr:NAD(P)-dependent oxidoreductase [Effusibacillus dendaii]BCJ88107.1 2-hydroxy-3-oxopropionate reductase [Effusibacillus dendaii]